MLLSCFLIVKVLGESHQCLMLGQFCIRKAALAVLFIQHVNTCYNILEQLIVGVLCRYLSCIVVAVLVVQLFHPLDVLRVCHLDFFDDDGAVRAPDTAECGRECLCFHCLEYSNKESPILPPIQKCPN